MNHENIPLCITSPIDLSSPNERISIYEGQFTLKYKGGECSVEGEIYYSWFPTNCAKFICQMSVYPKDFDTFQSFEIWINGLLFSAAATVSESSHGANFMVKGQCKDGAVLGDRSLPVNEITFVVPNLKLLEEGHIRDATHMFLGRTELVHGKFIVTLDAFRDHRDRFKALNAQGGFHLTYRGAIKKVKGNIRLKEIDQLTYALSNFLFFINGRRVAPVFLTGVCNGEKLWTEYSPVKIDPYKYVESWAQSQLLSGLNKMWVRFNELWLDENDRDFLETAIHWYVEANSNSGYVEGSIIFGQTALELLYNWLILEQKKMIKGPDAEGLSAANKIRLLIAQFNVDSEVPIAFKDLKKCIPEEDGPGSFVFIRNCLVHGQEKKRIQLKKMELMGKHEAVQLGVWYIELALLYILRFDKHYHNRTARRIYADKGDLLPWVNTTSSAATI